MKLPLILILEGVMKHKLFRFIIYTVIISLVMSLAACALKGDVYVAFYWKTANDEPVGLSDFSDIPNAPDNLNDLVNGGYFLTIPGSYSIDYVAFGGGTFLDRPVTLKAALTVGGSETTMYNIFLSNDTGVTVSTVP